MLKLNEEQKRILKNNLRPIEIFRIVEDDINKMLEWGLNKATILEIINKELNKNISLQTFYTYLRRNHQNKNISKINEKEKRYLEKGEILENPFNLLS